jgi:hypothetical protein
MLCLLLIGRRRRKKEREVARSFLSQGLKARHVLLTVLGGIFMAVRCN